jgi:hypothetical protein
MSGGSYAYSSTTSSTVTIEFIGTALDWVTATNSNFGIASVSVDGGASEQVDLYSSSIAYQQTVWGVSDLVDGRHTVVIEHTGQKNPASSGTHIGIDRVDVAGQLVPRRLDDANAELAFDGDWGTSINDKMFDGAYRYTLDEDGAMTVAFTGTSIAWITATNSNFGIAEVSLDGGAPQQVDLYSPSIKYQQTVWDSGEITHGRHVLEIRYTGTKNASSSGTYIGVDALDVAGYLTSRLMEQDDGFLSQSGSWSTSLNDRMSGDSYMYTNADGTTYVTFRGTQLDWITATNSNFGIAEVSLDGGPAQQVDLYSPDILYQQNVWSSGLLTHGVHTVEISWTGTKNAASTGTYIGVDAVEVVGSLVERRFEEYAAGIVYTSGDWRKSKNTYLSEGEYYYASQDEASATVTFQGKRLDWVTIANANMGIAEVSVDGGQWQQVDLYAATTEYQKVVWTTGELPNGLHTVSIRRTGSKNPASSGHYVGIDAIDVVGVLMP